MGAPFRTRLRSLGSCRVRACFHSLTAELIRGTSFPTEPVLRGALRTCMTDYNTVRLHSSLRYRSPLAFEHHAP